MKSLIMNNKSLIRWDGNGVNVNHGLRRNEKSKNVTIQFLLQYFLFNYSTFNSMVIGI